MESQITALRSSSIISDRLVQNLRDRVEAEIKINSLLRSQIDASQKQSTSKVIKFSLTIGLSGIGIGSGLTMASYGAVKGDNAIVIIGLSLAGLSILCGGIVLVI